MSKDTGVVLVKCYHCGNKGNLDVLNIKKTISGDDVNSPLETVFYYTLFCPVCKNISLYMKWTYWGYEDQNGDSIFENNIIYPENSFNFNGAPKEIKAAFVSAIRVKNIDISICALALRRVLEIVCKEKNAKGKNLYNMIQDLVNRKILPDTFDKAANLIKDIGNLGAHGDSFEYDIHDIEQLIDFVKSIINYLYCMPYDIECLQKKIEDRKKNIEQKP